MITAKVLTRKAKVTRGIPRKAYNPNRKAHYLAYLGRSTCPVCRLVFRTPAYRKMHEKSIHVSKVGLSRRMREPNIIERRTERRKV